MYKHHSHYQINLAGMEMDTAPNAAPPAGGATDQNM